MPIERRLRYVVTRVCLSDGTMTIQRSLRSILPASGVVTLRDSGQEWSGTVDATSGVVRGLGEFYRRQGLRVNDELHLELLADGAVNVTVVRASGAGGGAAALDERVKELVREWGQPIGAPELRSLWQAEGLPEVDFEGILNADGAFEKRDGCWRVVNLAPKAGVERVPAAGAGREVRVAGVVEASGGGRSGGVSSGGPWPGGPEPGRGVAPQGREAGPPVVAPIDRGDLTTLQQVARVFSALGFQVGPVSPRELLLEARLGKRSYRALLHVLGPKVDWSQLLAERRNRKAQFLAVTGPNHELTRIGSSAALAKATLWPLEFFPKLSELAELVPICPLELEAHFVEGGLIDGGLERFEETAGRLIEARGLISRMLVALADRPRGASLSIDELTDLIGEAGLDVQALDRAIDTLAAAPFLLLARLEGGELVLRQTVRSGLNALAGYAESVRGALPPAGPGRDSGWPG